MWQDILKSIAPVIGTAIGGPFGLIATAVLKSEWLGDKNASDEVLAAAIENATPEQLVQIRQIDTNFEMKMAELGVQKDAIAAQSTASAREMAVKTNFWPQVVLSCVFIVSFFAMLIGLMAGWITIQSAVKDTILLLLGLVVREIPTIMQFWFGSSIGSKEKTAKLMRGVN